MSDLTACPSVVVGMLAVSTVSNSFIFDSRLLTDYQKLGIIKKKKKKKKKSQS